VKGLPRRKNGLALVNPAMNWFTKSGYSNRNDGMMALL